MRNEEPWPTLNGLWEKIYQYRDQLYLQRDSLESGDSKLAIWQAKLDASCDIQQMLFEILRNKQQELKNDHPS